MMKESWVINRIGLVDFWYYDDQEFSFVNGRMLLRGANGSGKSVTMQSVVPLLLDGNMRPERLDPFGSRDRKMANYLLEEGDGRDERTGYLYMEFIKPETKIYHTVGMGIRARRGKTLESWYFAIADGRRINRDFYLYKESDGKITLSQKELEYRIGDGGKILKTQQEYMEYINRQMFGFETVDEYKEMIDLLIQLRTPKLSKDFKPTVINEILSDSLQPLSEEDMRPMSEAIENMDTLSGNLANKESSMQAVEKINKQFVKYSEYVLKEKIDFYIKSSEEEEKSKKEIVRSRENLLKNSEMKIKEEERKVKLEQEKKVLENEKESLNASDAVSLKQREEDVENRLKESKNSEKEKNEQLDKKQEKWIEYENQYNKTDEQKAIESAGIKEDLDEMKEGLEIINFDECSFLAQDILEHMEEEVSFDTHIIQVNQLRDKLETGTGLLKEMEDHKQQREKILQQYDLEKKSRNNIERNITDFENELQTLIQDQKEKFYLWNNENAELHLAQDTLQKINRFLEQFDVRSDYHNVKNWVSDCYFDIMNQLKDIQNKQQAQKDKEQEILDTLTEELESWKNKKEPEPEVDQAVRSNRENLEKKGIPYQRFYEVIDFDTSLGKEQSDKIEEALIHMGLLDALVIDRDYKEEVLKIDKGCCDKYIFANEKYKEKNLVNILSVSDEMNDLFGNQRVLEILGCIGSEEDTGTYIKKDGNYGIGILQGTITGEYKARFIGINARKHYKEEQILLLQKKVENQEEIVSEIYTELQNIKDRIANLEVDYTKIPKGENLYEKANSVEEKKVQLERQMEKISTLEAELIEKKEMIRELLEKASEISEEIYLECRLEKFIEAGNEMKEYFSQVMNLKNRHMKYLQIIASNKYEKERMDEADEDMEQIRYELSVIRKRLHKEELELGSVREQLSLTNYEEIKERLDKCRMRLDSIPKETEECIVSIEHCKKECEDSQKYIEKAEPDLEIIKNKTILLKQNLKKELQLKYTQYVILEDNSEENLDTQIERIRTEIIANGLKEYNKEDLGGLVNKVFYENRGYLLDFNPNLQSIFEEDNVEEYPDIKPKRLDINARYRGDIVTIGKLLEYLQEEIEDIKNLVKSGDKELFEDILANTIGRKIRNKINGSIAWVENMNNLMESMNTSSGLKLSLKWRSKTAENESQLDTRELVELLKKDARFMNESEFERLSVHFRSKVEEARRNTKDNSQPISFFAIMRETLDYRKWFEFQLLFQKSGEVKRELTNSIFGTFSGGEKAMSMYVPLFSAVVAKYQGAREDAPRIVSLDEAFAGVDNRNIRDMFRLMSEFRFNFIINSQVLWGDSDTLDGLAIYQLHRLDNQKFVTVMSFIWNGSERKSVMDIKN